MNVPKVSVVMAVFNQMNQTALNQAVDSILGQTLRDFEFLIYDDGSIPEAADYIRKQEEKAHDVVFHLIPGSFHHHTDAVAAFGEDI